MIIFVIEAETRQKLLRNVKKEVKQIMEEAVTRKFVHADSSHVISFCAVVEACVLHGLKRRIAGLLCTNKVAALFMKVSKSFSPAEELCRKVQELEQIIENSKQNNSSLNNDRSRQSKLPNLPPQALKNLWIRTALMEKLLDKIVLYLVENSSTFYDKEAMLMDPVDGPILASLLVGPCALEYTKVKTSDHFWTDPSADELVQRHRIHSGHCRQESPSRRPALIQKRQSSGSMDDRPLMWVKEYVESLHQNSRATLLFGKNNVLVQPRDDMEAIPGYLSLHQTADLMTLKWTPNQLMNGNVGELDSERSVYWDYAMTIRLEEIVYLHCHQQINSGGTVVLVSQDGIQRPPLHFPKGGHLLQFLTCLETGLLPHGQLDPPLWNQRGKGKVFPKLRKRSPHSSCDSVSDKEDDEATDYVFRILFPGNQIELMALELMDQSVNMWQPTPRKSSCSSCSQNGSSDGSLPNGCNQERAPLKLLCDTMKYQIISRAFYGWLAYCRHLSTVRTHLSALVNTTIVDPDVPCVARGGLSVEVWGNFLKDSSTYEEKEIHRLVYFGGVAPSLRKEVWPFLLGHYQFTMTEKCRLEMDKQMQTLYEQTMKEWQGCEVIVRQREREKHAEALARCSSGTSVERGPIQRDSTISTDASPTENQITKCESGREDGNTSAIENETVDTKLESVKAEHEKSAETSPSEGKETTHGDVKSENTKVNLKSAPEKTNVLKLEKEIHNEYFQAPPLGQTLSLQVHKNRDLEGKTYCPHVVRDSASSQNEKKTDISEENETTEATVCETRKAAENPPGSNSPVRQVLNALQSASRGSLTLSSQTRQSPDTADSDDSPSALEMEDIPVGITCQQTQDMYLINLHRIDKDVRRCDRTYWYFTPENLDKLRNIMCSYVWRHLDTGYVQGMCDLLAPLLVILDDEVMAFSCFTELMKRMNQNFPHGGAMDSHFANMRSLIQILDSELFELMQQNGDYTHFYFCYRWFLLDFKREMVYDDVFSVWETIWAAKHTSSEHFVLFIALALVEMYRDIILGNNMDFTDIIKFFNEMAERHDVPQVLMMARDLVHKVQTLIENK
uniref:Small G protein signaling modulator 1-like n=1 Tax=Oryzias melastigma TaxID=30732 RepID=A0A3B3CYA9_ORYME